MTTIGSARIDERGKASGGKGIGLCRCLFFRGKNRKNYQKGVDISRNA